MIKHNKQYLFMFMMLWFSEIDQPINQDHHLGSLLILPFSTTSIRTASVTHWFAWSQIHNNMITAIYGNPWQLVKFTHLSFVRLTLLIIRERNMWVQKMLKYCTFINMPSIDFFISICQVLTYMWMKSNCDIVFLRLHRSKVNL